MPINEAAGLSVAYVSALSALTAALVSGVVSYLAALRRSKTERERESVQYLLQKVGALKDAKSEIDRFDGLSTAGPSVDQDWISTGVLAIEEHFHSARSILHRVAFFVTPAVSDRLLERADQIEESLAFGRAKHHGIVTSPEQWQGNPERVLDSDDTLKAIADFPREVSAALHAELRRATATIEHLLHV